MPEIIKEDTTESVVEEEFEENVGPEVIMPEDLPADTELFEGGPTAGQIIEWKKQFGEVYVTEVAFDQYVVWRTINRGEYKSLVREINSMVESGEFNEVEINMYNEEAICGTCILFPEFTSPDDMDKGLAGMPSIVSQQILECSGFRPIDTRQL